MPQCAFCNPDFVLKLPSSLKKKIVQLLHMPKGQRYSIPPSLVFGFFRIQEGTLFFFYFKGLSKRFQGWFIHLFTSCDFLSIDYYTFDDAQ